MNEVLWIIISSLYLESLLYFWDIYTHIYITTETYMTNIVIHRLDIFTAFTGAYMDTQYKLVIR